MVSILVPSPHHFLISFSLERFLIILNGDLDPKINQSLLTAIFNETKYRNYKKDC